MIPVDCKVPLYWQNGWKNHSKEGIYPVMGLYLFPTIPVVRFEVPIQDDDFLQFKVPSPVARQNQKVKQRCPIYHTILWCVSMYRKSYENTGRKNDYLPLFVLLRRAAQ